jgi:2-methylcitrate dehydratase PrpD
MVKRLHFGRAAEGGVLAAGLAARGFDGPHDILEGQAGFLRVFCDHFDLDELTVGLDRSVFHMREVSMKRFGTHGSTQGPLQALLDIFSRRSATPGQIEWIDVEVSEDSLELHSGRAPADLMQAQYSIPFCVAIACVRDIEDPRSIGEDILDDPEVLRMLPKIRMKRSGYNEKRTCQVTVEFTDGAQLSSLVRDNAAAWKPASDDAVRRKYAALMRDAPADAATEKLERLEKLELQPNMDWLSIPPA